MVFSLCASVSISCDCLQELRRAFSHLHFLTANSHSLLHFPISLGSVLLSPSLSPPVTTRMPGALPESSLVAAPGTVTATDRAELPRHHDLPHRRGSDEKGTIGQCQVTGNPKWAYAMARVTQGLLHVVATAPWAGASCPPGSGTGARGIPLPLLSCQPSCPHPWGDPKHGCWWQQSPSLCAWSRMPSLWCLWEGLSVSHSLADTLNKTNPAPQQPCAQPGSHPHPYVCGGMPQHDKVKPQQGTGKKPPSPHTSAEPGCGVQWIRTGRMAEVPMVLMAQSQSSNTAPVLPQQPPQHNLPNGIHLYAKSLEKSGN